MFYYIRLNPIVPWTGCDFSQLGAPTTWDVGRETPKILCQIVGYFAAYVITPITGNYLNSIVFCVGFFVAALLTTFYVFLYRLFAVCSKNKVAGIWLAVIFIVVCFVIFKTQEKNNMYLFYAKRLTEVFFYLTSMIINLIIVLWLVTRKISGKTVLFSKMKWVQISALIVLIYFAMFSILWGAVVLVVYAFYEFIFCVFKWVKQKQCLKDFLDNAWVYILIGITFVWYSIIELTGARAENIMETKRNNMTELKTSLHNFVAQIKTVHTLVLVIICLIIAFYISMRFYEILLEKQRRVNYDVLTFVCCTIFIFVSYLIFCAVCSSNYFRIEAVSGLYFYFLLSVFMCLTSIINKCKKVVILIPLIFALLMPVVFYPAPLQNGTYTKNTGREKIAIVNNWIDQICAADARGETAVTIYYDPKIDIGYFSGIYENKQPGITLYNHGITSKIIIVKFEQI
jgi:hypothetical protein